MKKLLIIAACVLLCACAKPATTTRTAQATATEVSADAVIFTTDDGNEWEITGDAYTLGGEYTLTFDTQNTPSIYDDVILDIE